MGFIAQSVNVEVKYHTATTPVYCADVTDHLARGDPGAGLVVDIVALGDRVVRVKHARPPGAVLALGEAPPATVRVVS